VILARQYRRALDEVQTLIVRMIATKLAETGVQPTIAEIAAELCMSPTKVHYHLRSAAANGWIDLTGAARGVVLPADVREQYANVETPNVAEVVAPQLAEMEVRRG
jgi:SOS-response transcriptional repressor LexA